MSSFRVRSPLGAAWAALLFSVTLAVANESSEVFVEELEQCAAAPEKAPPLPFHSIEGVGGGAITPLAYLVNPGDECQVFGKPAGALTYVNLGRKNLTAIAVTETVFQRVELGYAADRLGLGTLPAAIHNFSAGAANLVESDVWLHNFNVRGLLVKENTCLGGIALPAITAGVTFKVNGDINNIDQETGGAFTGIGYRSPSGQDYFVTATKTIPPDVLGRPLILTSGLRLSNAAQLGFLGFGEDYNATFEGSIVYLPKDNLVLAYEFRQKTNPLTGTIPGVIEGEDNWHAFDVGLILNKHSTLVAGYGIFGNLANSSADGAWWLQFKHEF